jgi:hypothetical protein
VLGVCVERGAVKIFCEQLFGGAAGFVLAHAIEAGAPPCRFAAFDDEGRGVVFEFVGVGPNPAVLGFFEGKGEGSERLVGAEPDVFVWADVDIDAEVCGIG